MTASVPNDTCSPAHLPTVPAGAVVWTSAQRFGETAARPAQAERWRKSLIPRLRVQRRGSLPSAQTPAIQRWQDAYEPVGGRNRFAALECLQTNPKKRPKLPGWIAIATRFMMSCSCPVVQADGRVDDNCQAASNWIWRKTKSSHVLVAESPD